LSPLRRAADFAVTGLAALFVYLALVVPDQLTRMPEGTPWWPAFVRLPLEGIAGLALLLVLPRRARMITATVLGALLGVLTVLKAIDIGFFAALSRAFDPVLDWPLLADGYRFVLGSAGQAAAIGAAAAAVLAALAVPVAMVFSVRRLAAVAGRHTTAARAALSSGAVAWLVLALAGTSYAPAVYVASDTAVALAGDSVFSVPRALADQRAFERETADDAFKNTPPQQLLSALRGKDVIVAVVESYGRSAVQDPGLNEPVARSLADGTKQLAEAGYGARTGWLTSPTAGGGSWLAHATFQSGVWIDNQNRYQNLVSGDRLTLTGAFAKTGAWRTVAVEPGVTYAWPEGAFYGYQQVYDSHTLGYQGPSFSWASMPDQFTLKSFADNEYAKAGREPLMAELTFVSSHTPWAPVPDLIGWDQVGDGSVYAQQVARGRKAADVWKDKDDIRAEYAKSVAYSLDSVVSWVKKFGNDDLVMIVFGDHQPAPVVVGENASRDIPISVIAHDPKVLDRISGWNWTDGLRPEPQAPVWPMSDFRDRFLTAYGPASASPLVTPR
jgi:hypothetical protein